MKDPFQITVSKLVNQASIAGSQSGGQCDRQSRKDPGSGEGEALIVRFPEAYGLGADHQQFASTI